jgi:hypothetical protein
VIAFVREPPGGKIHSIFCFVDTFTSNKREGRIFESQEPEK